MQELQSNQVSKRGPWPSLCSGRGWPTSSTVHSGFQISVDIHRVPFIGTLILVISHKLVSLILTCCSMYPGSLIHLMQFRVTHIGENMTRSYILKRRRLHRWSLGKDGQFHPHFIMDVMNVQGRFRNSIYVQKNDIMTFVRNQTQRSPLYRSSCHYLTQVTTRNQ